MKQLLSAGDPAAEKQQAAPKATRQKTEQPTQGRFTSPAAEDAWTVTNLQVTKGGSGAQTLVTMQKPNGESVSGYIRGEAPLKTGQSIRNLKIIKKNSPIVGDYNIVESYQMAA